MRDTIITSDLQTAALHKGARNLLQHCAGLQAGSHLLIIHEPAGLGYYDAHVAKAVADAALACGLRTTLHEVAFSEEVEALDAQTVALMTAADCTVFFARLGDQLRFHDMPAGTRAVISYALDTDMLMSGFGTADYRAFVGLKKAIDTMVMAAKNISVTCALGTSFSGPGPNQKSSAVETPPVDVSAARFPMSVFAPVPAQDFSGTVAIAGVLMGTGSKFYQPYGQRLGNTLLARFDNGRLTGFDGAPEDVAIADAHYDDISRRFGIDRNFVHSWHAGIHPGCAYPHAVHDDYMRWSGGAFGNPRILHFHTCGAYAPGEICWNVVDPTVRIDGVAVWEDGRLFPERVPGAAQVLRDHPDMAALFDTPAQDIGIAVETLTPLRR